MARIDVPLLADARSLLLVVEQEDRVALHALAVTTEQPTFSFDVESLTDYSVYALVYQESLETLGLAAGQLEVVTDEPRKPLELAMHEYEVKKDGDGRPAEWVEAESRPSWVNAAQVRGEESPCARFAVQSLDVLPAANSQNEWGFAESAGEYVVAGTDFGELFHITADGRAKALDPPDMGQLRATSAAVDADGMIWVGDTLGRLWRGEVAAKPKSWVVVSDLTPVIRIDFMDIAPDGSEIIVMARDGAVAVYTVATGDWRVIHHVRTEMDSTTRKGGVLWLGRDDYLAVGPFSSTIARIRGMTVEEEVTGAEAGFTSIRRVPGVGIVAGTGLGELFVREASRWIPLPASGSRLWVLGMAELGEGFVFGSPYGNLGQYPSRQIACPVQTPVSFFIRFIERVGEGYVVLGESLAPPAPGGAVLTVR